MPYEFELINDQGSLSLAKLCNPLPDLSDNLSQSLLNIYDKGIAEAEVPLGHILLLHDLGYLNNTNTAESYISSMELSNLGLRSIQRRQV